MVVKKNTNLRIRAMYFYKVFTQFQYMFKGREGLKRKYEKKQKNKHCEEKQWKRKVEINIKKNQKKVKFRNKDEIQREREKKGSEKGELFHKL